MSDQDETYNGWPNWETYLVGSTTDNIEGHYGAICEFRARGRFTTEQAEETGRSLYPDSEALVKGEPFDWGKVDWEYIRDHWNDSDADEPSPNDNCLSGLRCPDCGSYGDFTIGCTVMATFSDHGSEDYENFEWTPESYCACQQCPHYGTIADYTVDQEEPCATPV